MFSSDYCVAAIPFLIVAAMAPLGIVRGYDLMLSLIRSSD